QGMAASAATIIAEACDHLIISPAGQMMIHKASTAGVGNSDDFTHTAGVLNTTDRTIASIYQSKTGKSEDEILNLMKQETYLTAQDADRKSTRLNSSHVSISYAVFCLKKKTNKIK